MPKLLENIRETILHIADDLLIAQGYDGLNMRDIARRCDISVGTIYNYFPSKQNLVLEIMKKYWREFIRKIDTIIIGEEELDLKLYKIFLLIDNFLNFHNEAWVKSDLIEFVCKSEAKQHNLYMDLLVEKIEILLNDYYSEQLENGELTSRDIAKFMIANYITLSQNKGLYSYESLEHMLKRVFV